MPVDLGLNRTVEDANITRAPRFWRRRIEAVLTGLYGDDNPFEDASLVDTGTTPGSTVKTDADGNVPPSVISIGGVTGVTAVKTSVVESGMGDYSKDMDLAVFIDEGTLNVTLSYELEGSAPVRRVEGELTLADVDTEVELLVGGVFEDLIDTGIDSTVTVAVSDTDIATCTPTGSGKDWTLLWSGVSNGSTAAVVTAVAGNDTVRANVSVTVSAARPEPSFVGLDDFVNLVAGQSFTDSFTVRPDGATVSAEQLPDSGFVDLVSLTNTQVIWRGVAPADPDAPDQTTRAILRVTDPVTNRFNQQYVEFDVTRRAQPPVVEPAPSFIGLDDFVPLLAGQRYEDDFTVFPTNARVSVEQRPDPGFVELVSISTSQVVWLGVAPADPDAPSQVHQARLRVTDPDTGEFREQIISFDVTRPTRPPPPPEVPVEPPAISFLEGPLSVRTGATVNEEFNIANPSGYQFSITVLSSDRTIATVTLSELSAGRYVLNVFGVKAGTATITVRVRNRVNGVLQDPVEDTVEVTVSGTAPPPVPGVGAPTVAIERIRDLFPGDVASARLTITGTPAPTLSISDTQNCRAMFNSNRTRVVVTAGSNVGPASVTVSAVNSAGTRSATAEFNVLDPSGDDNTGGGL